MSQATNYLSNKYKGWYDQIMDRAKDRAIDGYSERHHIVPRTFGGSNDKSNIVRLTYREHYLAHWLLPKFVVGDDAIRKMRYALYSMSRNARGHRTIISSWQYSVSKKAKVDAATGRARPDVAANMRGNKHGLGYRHTDEAKRVISAASRNISVETRAKIGKTIKDRGYPEQARAKMKVSM